MKQFGYYVITLLLMLAAFTVNAAEIPTVEKEALDALYSATNGDNWKINTGWNTTSTDVEMFGVTIVDGHVTKIILEANNLEGCLPPQLGNLSYLTELNLKYNNLWGKIPAELGNLGNLVYLKLANNALTGDLPTELSQLTKLKFMNLGRNHLTGTIPAEFERLSNLQYLYLYYNNFSGSITRRLGYLPVLKYLKLDHNEFSGNIPFTLHKLHKLESLELQHNQLTGKIPYQFGELVKLTTLKLNGNRLLSNIPPELVKLINLSPKHTDFGYNRVYVKEEHTELIAFLAEKDGDWWETQTISPLNVTAAPISLSTIEVCWEPIPYTADQGGYYVYYGTAAGGPYKYAGKTTDKTVSCFQVNKLTPGVLYYFVVKSRTLVHENNQSLLVSLNSNEASAVIPQPVTQ